ncbi:MAG: phospholipase D-like domain-containing protein [Gemmatimonadaceae bacterium]
MQILTYAGFILMGVIVAMALLIGFMDVVRGTPIKTVGTPGQGTECPAIDDPFFRESIELLTHVKLKRGHEVEFFINGDQTYPRLWEDLRSAKTSITLQLYFANHGKMADQLQEILIERAKAGIEIRFLHDAFGTTLKKEYFEPLKNAGVKVEAFRPFSLKSLQKTQHRAHIRVIVIDGEIGYTGGFGIDDKWFGTGRHKDQWRDTNVRFTGPAVRQLQATFVVCWSEASSKLLTSDILFPPNSRPEYKAESDNDGVLAAVLHASPTIGSTPAERFFVLSIAAARQKLYISNSYFVPEDTFRKLLCESAQRGVDVRVLTVSKATDTKSTWYAGRAKYEQLLKGGVRIFEYQPVMMHAKTLVVDGAWVSVGSMNADNRSISFNDESNLVILDEGEGARMERMYLEDLKFAEEIKLDEFSKRPLQERIAEFVCHLVWRVL